MKLFNREKISCLDDFFCPLDNRKNKGVFFYRICGYSNEIKIFIKKYYEAARKSGVIIEGKIANPDEKNLAYYEEIMGMQFQLELNFIATSLKKWLPRMTDYARENVALSLYDALCQLKKAGKNDNMLKNAYIKFMCWMYYKFERIANQLGQKELPKILYEGDISNYELILISVLVNAGCDVILLQYHGDENYLKLDPQSTKSDLLQMNGLTAFPKEFSLKQIIKEIQNDMNRERLYGAKPEVINCTNAWITGKGLEDFRTGSTIRGKDNKLFYNCFYRINGVEDKLIYVNELHQFYMELKNLGRKIVVVDEAIPKPSMEEIATVNRRNYANQEQVLLDLANNIKFTGNMELQRLMVKAFIDILLEENERQEMNVNKLTNKAVYLICWLKRYQNQLFSNWKMPEVSCFIHMGACQNEAEATFLRMLARLPVDVLILKPNHEESCLVSDKMLYELTYSDGMVVKKFPEENAGLNIGTAAFHAERELDGMMYQNTGLYRNQQYSQANVINLQTMYEEIKILWDQELKYRPNFGTVADVVNIPVICAKVSGVKNRDLEQYWRDIKTLITEDTIYIEKGPYINRMEVNPVKAHATEFFRNGKLQRSKIKSHSCYQYSFLREEMQDYILEKLQVLIDRKFIKGTFENGTEYMIISIVLNLPKDIVRMLQKFDFTKKNPKIIYINTKEEVMSLEDSIMMAFLNLIGFDIVFFVPTGYQSIEQHYNRKMMEEHQIGEYVYDLNVPNMATVSLVTRTSWRDKIFKRGR